MNAVKRTIYHHVIPLIGRLFVGRNKIVNIIYYHDIVREEGFSSQQTNIETFKQQMLYLHKQGYRTFTFDELDSPENLKFRKKHLVIAFDDGWISNYTEIFDFMKSLGIKYNIYLTIGKIGEDNNYLTWNHVRHMHASGIVGFGVHTFTHPSMADISAINPDVEIAQANCKFEQELGYAPLDFCYPFGYFSDSSNDYLLANSPYTRIYTSQMAYSRPVGNKVIFGRNSIVNEEPISVFKNKARGYYNIFDSLTKLYYSLRNGKR